MRPLKVGIGSVDVSQDMGRRIFQLIVALMVPAVTLVAGVAPARADNVSSLLVLVNTLRAANHEAPLVSDPTLAADAQAWSAHMAATGGLSDNPNLASEVAGGWTGLAENTGEGGNIQAIFNALVQSPIHLDNMVHSSYNLTGIAVVVGKPNMLWVTENFEAFPGTPPATTPQATTTTVPRRASTTVANAPKATTTTPTTPKATTTASASTAPGTTAPTTTVTIGLPDATGVAQGGGGQPPGLDAATTVPGAASRKLVAAAAATHGGTDGGAVGAWALAASLLAVALAVVGGGAYAVNKAIRR